MATLYARCMVFFVVGSAFFLSGPRVWAHCDGLDGPVVTSARHALEVGDINQVLIWVRAGDEAEIRTAFAETMNVRKLSPEAQALADRYFFETLVRVHRAGEGAPYTGLKPAGRDLGPAIPAADKAIETGSDEALVQLLIREMQRGLRAQFETMTAKKASSDDVAAGREYIDAYVPFIHYVESLYEAAVQTPEGHYPEAK
jgi:Family of unknown function (DUF6448)